MVSWQMPDGTEIDCVGTAVDADGLRQFVLRFMSADDAWDAALWDDVLLRRAFEERFGQRVGIHREDLPGGGRRLVIRAVPESGEADRAVSREVSGADDRRSFGEPKTFGI